MAETFADRIFAIEREVLALKTSHPRGLGVVEFSSVEESAAVTAANYMATITVTFADGEPLPAFAQLELTHEGGKPNRLRLAGVNYSDDGKTITYTYYIGGIANTTLIAKVVSIAQVASVDIALEEP